MVLFCCHLQINKLQGEIASARCMGIMHVPAWFYFQDRVSICNPEEALISGGGSRSINHLQALKGPPWTGIFCSSGATGACVGAWYVYKWERWCCLIHLGTHGCIFQSLASATGNSATVLFLLSFISFFLHIYFPFCCSYLQNSLYSLCLVSCLRGIS